MSTQPDRQDDDGVPFDKVLEAEIALIAAQREASPAPPANNVYARAHAMSLTGLAFSGGGIRSAAFNLGFSQGLANHKALHLFDYLSTVSGGGYTGGFLSALLHREMKGRPDEADIKAFQATLETPQPANSGPGISGFPPPEAPQLRFVRRYANYLTPRLGLSGDTLALLANALRNFTVMQTLLISLLVAGFALLLWLIGLEGRIPPVAPYVTPGWLAFLSDAMDVNPAAAGRWLMPLALGLIFLALLLSQVSQNSLRGKLDAVPNMWVLLALVAALASGVLVALGIRIASAEGPPMTGGDWVRWPALGYGVAWVGNLLQARGQRIRALAGVLAGAACFALALHLCMAHLGTPLKSAPTGYIVAFAPLCAMTLYALIITIHLAFAGSALSEQQREWWARAGGQGTAMSLVWAAAFAFLLFVPPLMQFGQERAAHWLLASGGLWTALTWLGTHFASGKDTDGEKGTGWKELAAVLAPWLFLGGLLGLVAWAFVSLLPGTGLPAAVPAQLPDYLHAHLAYLAKLPANNTAIILAGAGGLFLLLLVFVDLNLFSAHSFYCSRLARTFLGASRLSRKPNPYTGFDPADDLKLADLYKQDGSTVQRPLHLINATLNVTGGEEMAWQTRRGTSFVFSPLFCGYSARSSRGETLGTYRPTADYGGSISLATAMAISGAAASPNMGFHTSAPVAALLTVFNLRLARWCPNPTLGQWRRKEPRWWSAGPLFAELFGEARADSKWINLSDGGHFENLGIYELIRRRASLIVVTDVSADDHYQFDDLAMAKRKLYIDFGVELEIDATALDCVRLCGEGSGPRFSTGTWAIGRIHYPDGAPSGHLIYVKSALTADAPIDIRQYRDAHPAFPHESTGDQWFDENQFEAYRHLGQFVAEKLCREWLDHQGSGDPPAGERIREIRKRLKTALDAPAKPPFMP
jgi:hypothetical protein